MIPAPSWLYLLFVQSQSNNPSLSDDAQTEGRNCTTYLQIAAFVALFYDANIFAHARARNIEIEDRPKFEDSSLFISMNGGARRSIQLK